jgi:glycosyltransferase involved in cell wall biosynthesis
VAQSLFSIRLSRAGFRLSILVPVLIDHERQVLDASIRRILDLRHDLIQELQVIVIDDGTTDGTREVLRRLAETDERVVLLRHDRHRGKGAAIRTGLLRATGDVTLIHDADLEYHPDDIPALLVPFATEGADAVFGSRYVAAAGGRASTHRPPLTNRALTRLGNWCTDLHLTDLETCYKAINTTLLTSIPLRSRDGRFDVEIAFKLAKRRARIFEVPIRCAPRTRGAGTRIGARGGWRALLATLRFWLVDDIYEEDAYGSHILVELERARRFNLWLADTLRPYVGERVLEIGAGIGTLTSQFIPRELYVASDINPDYLHYLWSYSFGKPYVRVMGIDAGKPDDFRGLREQFDTALMVNVLEHVPDENTALENLRSVLKPGGRALVLVPQHPGLYSSLDTVLEHRKRYTRADLESALARAGLRAVTIFDFNRFSVPGWWLNGRLLRRKRFSRIQLKIVDTALPLLKRVDRFWPWSGLSLIAVAVKE